MFWAFAGGFSKSLLDSIETKEEREAVKQQMELQTKLQERLEKLRADMRLGTEEGARVVAPDTGKTTVYNRKGEQMFEVTDPSVPLRTQMEKDKGLREAARDEALNEQARAQAAAARAQAGRTAALTPVEIEATRALAEQRRQPRASAQTRPATSFGDAMSFLSKENPQLAARMRAAVAAGQLTEQEAIEDALNFLGEEEF